MCLRKGVYGQYSIDLGCRTVTLVNISPLKIEKICFSETLEYIYESTRRHNSAKQHRNFHQIPNEKDLLASIKVGGFINNLSNYQFLKKESEII
jgi:hypothetical protein